MEPNNNPNHDSQSSSGNFFRLPAPLRRHPLRSWAGLLVLLVLVLTLGWNYGPSGHKAVVSNAAQVSINASGFNPRTILIHQGQQVSFTNNDSSPHWVESDPYPTHTSLPGLNSDALTTNSSYSYSFEKPGTYTYHDRLNPYKLQGTVKVE